MLSLSVPLEVPLLSLGREMEHRPAALTPFSVVAYIVEFVTYFLALCWGTDEVEGPGWQFNACVIQAAMFHGEVP